VILSVMMFFLNTVHGNGASQPWIKTSETVIQNKSPPLSCLSQVFCHSHRQLIIQKHQTNPNWKYWQQNVVHMPVIPTLWRLRQKDHQLGLHSEFEDSLGYKVRLCLKKKKKLKEILTINPPPKTANWKWEKSEKQPRRP
jgi:hypothetical protein